MRSLSSILWSGTALALALAATPVAAQTAPTPGADPVVDDAAQPADEAAADPANPETADDAIIVTGIRKSLESAKNLKRRSDEIVDAIVAEDIGKLPDIAVSDTAARIPGVQVERGGGEAGRVLVRGLPDFTTTYNGREIFTAETRQVALQDFPAGAIAAVEVYKSSAADLVEAGLAGLINVRSRRPFDFKGLEVAGSVWGVYPLVSRDLTPNFQLLASNRWKLGDGEIGALLNFSYTKLHYRDSTRSNTDFVAGGPGGTRFPDIQRITYGEGERSRPSLNGAIQWRPTPNLEFYIEGLWQGFRNELSDRELTVPLWGGEQYTNITTRPGTNLITGGTVVNPFRPDGFQGGTLNRTNTYQFAIGGSWDAGPLKVSADLARTDSKFTGETESVDFAFASPQTIDFVTNTPGSDGPTLSIRNFDPSNPANYVYRGFYEEYQVAKGDDWQARLDADYDTGLSFIPKIEAGIRYVDRDADRQFGNRYSTLNGGAPITAVPLDYELFDRGFRGDDLRPFPSTWLSPTYDSIRGNLDDLRTFAGYPSGSPDFNPREAVSAKEKSTALYAQMNYKVGIIDGQIGLRYVTTKDQLSGTQLFFAPDPDGAGPLPEPPGVLREVNVNRKYTDWLPSASARIRFSPEWQLRLSATKTRTRPSFRDLSPSSTIDRPGTCFDVTPIPAGCTLTGGGGNPYLQRLKSNNYDASLEYYFSPSGFASVAIFRRDLRGFIEGNSVDVTEPVSGRPLRLFGPANSGAGRIDGAEAQIQTFFDWSFMPEFARRFGIQANITYLDAKADFDYTETLDGIRTTTTVNRRLLGVSKYSSNLVGMYEGGGLSVRLSYNRRSSFLTVYQRRDAFALGALNIYEEKVRPVSRLDLSTNYIVTPNVTVFYDWTNILKQPFRSELRRTQVINGEQVVFPRAVRYEESVISGGIRFRL